MDLKDFKILKILSEEKNIKKTADRLFISQPAISWRIQQLEKELNVRILIRTCVMQLLSIIGYW